MIRRPLSPVPTLLVLLLAIVPGFGTGAETVSLPATATADGPEDNSPLIENAREAVRSSTLWLARGVDSWFGDVPFEKGGKVSDGRLSIGLLKRQDDSLDLNVRFNARFALPNVERLTYLFVGNDDRRDVVSDTPGALTRQDRLLAQPRGSQSFFAGFGRDISDAVDLRLGVRGRLNVYAQARFRKRWQVGDQAVLDFKQTLFYSREDRLGSTTAAAYERVLSPTLSLRGLVAATSTQKEPDITWSGIVGAYRSFGDQRLLSVEALAGGRQHSGTTTTDRGIQTRWEQPIYKNWLVGGVVLGRFWPRPDATVVRQGVWALGANLQMHF